MMFVASQWSVFTVDIYLLCAVCVRYLFRKRGIAKFLVEGLLFGGDDFLITCLLVERFGC